MSKSDWEAVKRKRSVQGAISITGATLGLAALGSKGGAMALRRYPKALKAVTVNPKTLDRTSLGLMTAGAGVGGLGGYHYAALQRAENKSQNETEKVIKMYEHSAFGVITKAKKEPSETAQNLGYAGAVGGTTVALAAPDIRNKAMRGPRQQHAKIKNLALKASDEVNEKAFNQMRENRTAGYEQWKWSRENVDRSKHWREQRGPINVADRDQSAPIKLNKPLEAEVKAANDPVIAEAEAKNKMIFDRVRASRKKLKAISNKRSTGKVAGTALLLGGASLAAGEGARRHNQKKKFGKSEWWSDTN